MMEGWGEVWPDQAGRQRLTRPVSAGPRDCLLAEVLAALMLAGCVGLALVLIAIPLLFLAWLLAQGWHVAAWVWGMM
jgi:hypothetical protein